MILIKNKIAIFFIAICISFSQETNYLPFEIISYNNPYPANIFIHNLSHISPITGTVPRYMAIIDSTMNPVWAVNSGPLGLDFKVQENKITYFNDINNSWIVLDRNMVEVDTLRCVNGYYTDFHDIHLLPNGGYILQAYDSMSVDLSQIDPGGSTSATVVSLIIQEFDSANNLLLEWNAWDHLNIANYSYLNLSANFIMWMHGNSLYVDVDSNIIISNRRSSEIIKIDRNSGQIIWILGGPNNQFTIINDSYNGFSRQHDAKRLENGNLLLFDNGNDHEPAISRALEYELDEIEMTADLIWEFSHPEGFVGLAMGSVQRLPNNNTLINWGRLQEEIGIITEVDQNNNIVLEIKYSDPIYCYNVTKSNWQFDTNLIAGDVNLDGKIDIFDLIIITDYSIQENSELNIYRLYRFDINRDRIIDEYDIFSIIEKIMDDNVFR
ncbi:MAG: aryl-sulfate sulfotransferase [Candidatus Neomarinimicrobiota bacterium]